MSLDLKFADVYNRTVYRNGMMDSQKDLLTNPRGLARSLDYSGALPSSPIISEDNDVTYDYAGVSKASLDLMPPKFLPTYEVYRNFSADEIHTLTSTSVLATRPLINTDMWLFAGNGSVALTILRAESIIPPAP